MLRPLNAVAYSETAMPLKLEIHNTFDKSICPLVRAVGGNKGQPGEVILDGSRIVWGGGAKQGYRLGWLNDRLRPGESAYAHFLIVPQADPEDSQVQFVLEDTLTGRLMDTVDVGIHFIHSRDELSLPSYVCRFWPEMHEKRYLNVDAVPKVVLRRGHLFVCGRHAIDLRGRISWDEARIDTFAVRVNADKTLLIARVWMMWFRRDLEIPDQERVEIWLDNCSLASLKSDSHWREITWDPRWFLPMPIKVNVGIPFPLADQLHTPCPMTGERSKLKRYIIPVFQGSRKFYKMTHDARRTLDGTSNNSVREEHQCGSL